jgi:polysaccharide export outer membrane protein
MKNNYRFMGFVLFTLILMLTWSLPALAQDEPQSDGENMAVDYLVGAGDLLEVVIWKNADLSGVFRVRPDGKFSMPLIGNIFAAGRTTDEINAQIQEKLQLFIDTPYVSTIVRETTSNRVYVFGEVVNPGAYSISGTLTVLQAVALAGGFTKFADRERMVLIRGSGERQQNFNLNYKKILSEPGAKYNMLLERGDTLVVP